VSKAARWPAGPENWDYFRGPVNAAGRARVAFLSLAQDIDFTNKKAIFTGSAVTRDLSAQPAVLIGLIAHVVGTCHDQAWQWARVAAYALHMRRSQPRAGKLDPFKGIERGGDGTRFCSSRCKVRRWNEGRQIARPRRCRLTPPSPKNVQA
jgi:hypothetical protein